MNPLAEIVDGLALALMLAGIAVALAVISGDPIAWARNEWRLMRAKTWEPGRERITGGSIDEPKVKAMDTRLRAYAKRLRRNGRSLTAGKRYIPVLTKPVEAPPPRGDKVVPIRKQR